MMIELGANISTGATCGLPPPPGGPFLPAELLSNEIKTLAIHKSIRLLLCCGGPGLAPNGLLFC
jgi:hypothetical protein